MEDEERLKKLEAGKAKLAEYRQRKAHADGQKMQKKKKKRRKGPEDSEGDGQGAGEAEHDQSLVEEVPGGGGGGGEEGDQAPTRTEYSFARTLRSGETVKHDQTYTIEPESELSTTAEDYSSEVNGCHETTEIPMQSYTEFIWEEVDPLQKEGKEGRVQDVEDELAAKSRAVEELRGELEEVRSAFEGVQQLQDFEAALKQRDSIITQLTANLQQAREEKAEIMREFLEMTEQSQKLQIQFQQLQAGEMLRNSSHSSAAADLLQARQQLLLCQQQADDMAAKVKGHEERSAEQLLMVTQLQHRLSEAEMVERRTEESFAQRLNEKDLLIAEQEIMMLGHERALAQLKEELALSGCGQESFTQRANEKDLMITEQTAIITGYKHTLAHLKEELELVGRREEESHAQRLREKDLLIAAREKGMLESDHLLAQLRGEVAVSETQLNDLRQHMTVKSQELESCKAQLDSSKVELESYKTQLDSSKVELESSKVDLESCKAELSSSRQKERMSSGEIQQLMGTVENLQKRCHQGSLSDSESLQRTDASSGKLEHLRAELDEMYGQQIVQMKQELRSQHSAQIDRLTEQHRAELETLKAAPIPGPSPEAVAELDGRIAELQERLWEARALQERDSRELNQVAQDKLHLQGQVRDLLRDLRSSRAEQESLSAASQEKLDGELRRLRETIDGLKAQLVAAGEASEEAEVKHESETTNYKIKLEMMEREKDAVLDRMAQSQEAELDRLRTQLLFSHEEELTLLREDLQRESRLNAENLLNEAAVKHERASELTRSGYENRLRSMEGERAASALERDELMHQIVALKEDLKLALHSSRADELLDQQRELQVEVEELRKGGEERVRLEREVQKVLRNYELLENQIKEKETGWGEKWKAQESEKMILRRNNEALKEEVESQNKTIKSLTSENEQRQQQVVELRGEVEKQKSTFSFAEKNFEVNYQELKEEYSCLIEVKAQMEKIRLKETLDFEAKIQSLELQNLEVKEHREVEHISAGDSALTEKDATEVMEKLEVALSEKDSLTARLSEVTESLFVTQREAEQLEAELTQVRTENKEVISRNENLEGELKRERETSKKRESELKMDRRASRAAQSESSEPRNAAQSPACAVQDHTLQITSLRDQVEGLRSSLQKAEKERDYLRSARELQGQVGASKPAAAEAKVQKTREGPAERDPSSKPSGSSRRRRRQRGKQDRHSSAQAGERAERKEEEVEEEEEGAGACEGEQAGSAAERETQAQMESLVETRSRQRVREEDAADGCHDNDVENKEQRSRGVEPAPDAVAQQREARMESTEHTECKLQLEAQRISLSQIHAAQLELLREQAAAHSHTLVQGQGQARLEEHRGTGAPELARAPPAQGPGGLEVELQKQRAELEERHKQEVERLRSSHRQQAEESERRHATELMVLRQRLHEDPGTQISLTSVPQLTSQREQEEKELKLLEEEEHQEEEHQEEEHQEEGSPGEGLAWPARSADLTAQLQSLRRALYHKYTQEVSALREQHSAEIRRLSLEREQGGRKGAGEEGEEGEGEALSKEEEERLNGEERRHQERVEEEIAKVIVKMSVEFAQQSELARMARRAGETSSAVQTQSEEEEEEEGMPPPRPPTQGAALEEVERRFRKQKEKLEKELEEKNKALHRLMEQVEHSGGREEQKRGEAEEEEGDEEEGKEKRALGERSHDGGESTCSDVITTERNLLRKANASLRQVLRDVLKTTAAAEETIGRHVEGLLEASTRGRHPPPQRPERADVSTESCHGSETRGDDASVWSGETDEGLEVSDSLLQGAELQNEEYLMNISARLQAAVEKLLVAITETTNQLEHARLTQTELMRESFRHSQEMGDLLQRQEELQERLGEEARAREQLALELHRAEGLIDGYTGERAAQEQQLRHKEELHLSLEQELQVTSSRLRELEQERLLAQQERELLSRQQDAMRETAGPREMCLVEAAGVAAPEADLLEETEKLMKEKVEVQRQAEKESLDLLKQVKLLEGELEEQVNKAIELDHAQKTENGDLRQQIQALEKQLEKNRKFLDEQAVDREHERDVFQQEILKLEQQLKNPQKLQAGSEQRTREVDQLTSQLKQKADWCSELLLSSEQLQREVSERNEEIDKLEGRVRELEQALLTSTETLDTTEEKRQHVSVEAEDPPLEAQLQDPPLEAQLQTEREALDRKEKEIANLEEQLEQFREELENKSEETHQLQMQLQIQRKEISTQQDTLDVKHNLIRVLEERDREIDVLNEQIAKLQHAETASDNKDINEKDELIRELESRVEFMRNERDRLKRNSEEELYQLNAVIEKLQEELANIEQKQAAEEEDEEEPPRPESQTGGPSRDEYDKMKQRVDLATHELVTLKAEHGSLLDTYLRLKESALALAESEKLDEALESDFEDALREKTAAFLVMQAQVQALEQSATSRVEELSRRVQDLEGLVGERDSELARCRFLVEKAQEDADELQHKVSNLEDKLRDRVAATLVSQAQLGAVQQQSHASKDQGSNETDLDTQRESEAAAHDFGFPGIPKMDFGVLGVAKRGPAGKVVLLTEKLRELEVGLSSMQRDQELQKQLLSSSEVEVMEYERRLATLMDLLNQMKPAGHLRTSLQAGASSTSDTSVSNVLQELQEVREEAAVTRQQLSNFKESSSRLQEELKAKEIAVAKLQEDLQRALARGAEDAKMAEMRRELRDFKQEASAAKEELSSCKERCDKLQELLQEREMAIAHLKGELHQASSEGLGPERSELLQELQDVRDEAASTKEQLTSFRESTDELQGELQARDLSIAQLQEEVRKLGAALAKADVPPSPSPSPQPLSSSAASSSSQPKKKGGKQGSRKAGDVKDKQTLVRKSSAPSSSSPSEKPRTPPLNNGSERPRSPTADSSTQTEPSPRAPGRRADEEAEGAWEVVREYQEKIGQMLELHAAEILDMEARHIAESEALRRESEALRREGQHTEEECRALKAVIDKLCSSEAASSRPERPAASHLKDGYTSDSSSDWSQRTGYDLPNLQQEFRSTPEGARRETDDALPDRIKTLLREVHQEGMQVLSLSELPAGEAEAGPAGLHGQGWAREREALVATVDSLKNLLTQMNRDTQTSGGGDWRAELLGAVQQVFVRERSVLKSALYARLDLLDTSDAIIHLNQLERRLAEQDSHHREAMGNLYAADRSSLLSEVQQLRAQMEHLQTPDPSLRDTPSQGVQSGVEAGSPEPRGRSVPQGGAGGPPEAPQMGRAPQRGGGGPLEPPQADRGLLEELRGELAQTKLELETTLKAQHKHLTDLDMLRAEVSQKASEVDSLTDRLSDEQKKTREQQWALEKERCKSDRREETGREELEDLKLTVEDLQSQVAQLTSGLDQERQAASKLSLQAQQEGLSLHSRLSELQVQLESERARAQELSSALGREKEMRRGGGQPQEGEEGEEGEEGVRSAEAVLDSLQRELDEKHAQVVRLLGEVETHKLEAVRRQEVLTSTGQRSQQDQEALQAGRAQLQDLQEALQETQAQLRKEAQRSKALEQEKERLEERVARLGEAGETAGRGTQGADGQNQPSVWTEPTDRTRDWVFHQKSTDTQTAMSGTPSLHEPTGSGVTTAPLDPRSSTDMVMGKLQLIAGRIRALASKAPDRLTTEVDREELTWLQSNVDEVISMLQRFLGLPPAPESAALLAGGSLTERLLRQNAELTGFVSRLTEEKNELRNQTLRLEEELRRYRHAGLGGGLSLGSRRGVAGGDTAGALFSQEREAWGRERSRLEKGLRAAQAELSRLRGELRTEAFRDASGPDADNTALKRMYGKYLRSESFRKALIYQKKYLLLLLGGFQECEEATLSLISRMGGRPSVCSLESQRRRGLTRFRSAVRVSIALSRMRFLVKRWQKATGMSSASPGTVNRNSLALTPGSDVRDSPFLHPGSVEVFADRQGATSRGRSGRDSPRSAMSSTQHRFHLVGDPGPLSCSHLQSYDPDRALTDYISRLEALQRRLGGVTSGSSSYAQLHFGMRR
ncbi:A-kinase anchor protein 9 [Osmerus eperlanus]|uniref:A-kinase anchor protein 9 n=1 Tax=Osmerus eperlanus TaxID=29151 RepID=UPI002E12A9CC